MSKLFVVPTPIGNIEDITLRAIRILKEVEIIFAEDTRTSTVLLNHYGINSKLLAYHQFNEHQHLSSIIKKIQSCTSVAIISDAGTPGISDAGFLLIRECIKNDIAVECLPGATAFVPALVSSGLACDRFFFEGFLPHKKGRQVRLSFLSQLPHTIILYESPHRLSKTLEQCAALMGRNRKAVLTREITKIYEETIRLTLGELADLYKNKKIKGEIVLIIEGKH